MCKGLHTKNVEAFPFPPRNFFFYSETDALIPKFRIAFYRWTVGDNKISGEKKNSCDIGERLRDVHTHTHKKKMNERCQPKKKLYFKFQSGADHLKLYDNLTS